jgi:hypothetical protein
LANQCDYAGQGGFAELGLVLCLLMGLVNPINLRELPGIWTSHENEASTGRTWMSATNTQGGKWLGVRAVGSSRESEDRRKHHSLTTLF